MPLGFTSSDDTLFDFDEAVSYVSVLPAGNTTVTVNNAVGLSITSEEVAQGNGFWDGSERIYWLPVSQMQGLVPKEGDYLIDSTGVNWSFPLEAKTVVFGTQYRLTGKKQRS